MWVYTDEVVDVRQENIKLDPSYIPTEIWNTILTHLADSAKSVVSASMVSKQFYNLVMNDELLLRKWRKFVSSRGLVLPQITDNVIKICVGGMGGSGKSATVIQFCQHQFLEEYDPTIEDSYRKQYMVDGATYLFDILDMAGPEEYSAMLHGSYRIAHGLYMVYSITNRDSFTELEHYLTVAEQAKESDRFPVIIAGNKCDLESQRQVPKEEAEKYAEKRHAQYIETSAKTRHNIEEAFTMLARIIVEANEGRNGIPNKNKSNTKKDRCLMM
jgi:GTPase KRas protein